MTATELRARRKALGVSQAEIAAMLGVARTRIAAWEAGRQPIPLGVDADLLAIELIVDHIVAIATAAIRESKPNDGLTPSISRVSVAKAALRAGIQLPYSALTTITGRIHSALRAEGITTLITD